ncbi:MAG: hypothetical protein PHU91_03990 [Candidatus Omnitrophica bacterium]|nr:hypothetical protein [Candidatus Omnitrophota bacterium]MDD5236802.1 hypothetical protein [Candidatus Omnitrophota bacterium]MDD5610954.1 hypothetical protein [Candidatus Omnitrophota bacterium]
MKFSKSIIGRFYLETQVKSWITGYFLRDAREWLHIYNILQEQQDDWLVMSYEAKKFINLRFSFECSLKSLIMSLSNKYELASQAYEILRRHQHDLSNLYKECLSRGRRKYRIISPSFEPKLAKIDNLGIGIRYDLDFKTAYKRQSFRELFVDGPVSSVVLDDSFRKDFLKETTNLYKRARKIESIRFAKHHISTGDDAGRVENYIRTKIIR